MFRKYKIETFGLKRGNSRDIGTFNPEFSRAGPKFSQMNTTKYTISKKYNGRKKMQHFHY